MASKVTKNSNNESNVIKCKNCRQDISKDKMFLHEGFCTRNNIFCEHCEKVFLKKDYEEHVKLIPKFLSKKENSSTPKSQKSKETQPETLKPSSFTEENENINNNNVIPSFPKPSLQIVQMPITELYKINEPIFVSETGQVVSNQNRNEYILPLLGINFRSSKISEKILDEIIDQGDIFKENNTISQNCYDIEGLSKILNKNDFNSSINNNNMTINTTKSRRDIDFSFGLSSIHGNNSINSLTKNSLMNSLNSPISKTIETDKFDSLKQQGKENRPLNRKSPEAQFKTLYANKSTSNQSQTKFTRKFNFFNEQKTPKKPIVNNSIVHDNIKRSVKENIPLDKENRNTPKRIEKNNNLDESHEYYNYPTNKKEPKDSNSKKNSMKINFKFSRFSGIKKYNPFVQSEKKKLKDQLDSVTCQYCHNKCDSNKFDIHVQNCNVKKKRASKILDIPKPKRKQEIRNLETYIFDDTDEIGISETKRETLSRQFNPSTLNIISLNSIKNNNTLISNPNRRIYSSQFMNDPQKISLKKKLFDSPNIEKIEKKKFPEDNNKKEVMDNIKGSKLRNRLYNFSLDENRFEGLSYGIKSHKSIILEKRSGHLKSGEIDSFLYFNNNKVIFKFPKDKKVHKNTII